MKTTLEIPDDLYRAVKAKAALEGKRVTDIVTEGLRMVVAGPRLAVNRVELPIIEGSPDSPVITSEDVKRALESMDEEEALAIAKHCGR